MNSAQFDLVLHRIRSLVHPQHVWIEGGRLCCGDDYPDGVEYCEVCVGGLRLEQSVPPGRLQRLVLSPAANTRGYRRQ